MEKLLSLTNRISREHPFFLQENKVRLSLLIILVTYFVGIVVVKILDYPDFLRLTPLQLLTSFALLLWNHEGGKTALWRFTLLAFLTGYSVEVAGVATGIIFGEYAYGEILGPKLWDTPLLIGINWAMVVYCGNASINRFLPKKTGMLIKVMLGAAIPVALDWFIEPVAIRYGMWTWENGAPPLHNYIGWYATALVLSWAWQAWLGSSRNVAAVWLLGAQLVFFIVLGW